MARSLPFRQVHLDLHTSEHIPGIGSDFDPDRFTSSLKAAHVNSVTLFSRCHHGWIYHDTKFDCRHPHLKTNLLAEQIRACHKADIRCPIYITVGWDAKSAREHLDWVEVHQDGRSDGAGPLEPGWKMLDFASPYLDFVQEQTAEVFDLFGDEVDGIFFDIVAVSGVHGPYTLREFEAQDWDPASRADQQRMRRHLLKRCVSMLTETVRSKSKDCGIFFNSGHISPASKDLMRAHYSHLEVESLPTGGWGYNHFPVAARYSRVHGMQFLGMTGKFGETWGHFNSYKPAAALEYETRLMVALGGRCSVGDQLHPRGELDPATYDLIGSAYRQIAELEPWLEPAAPVADIAVLHAEPYGREGERTGDANVGAYRILTEGRHQFDFVDEDVDLTPYRVLILPDIASPAPEFLARVDQWIEAGGSLIVSGSSSRPSDALSATVEGPAHERHPLFIQADPSLDEGLAGRTFVVYRPCAARDAAPGAEVLATFSQPYFSRTYQHFCSHNHAPVEGPEGRPAVAQKGRVIDIASPVFEEYAQHPALEVKKLVLAALARLMPDPMVAFEGPSTVQAHALSHPDGVLVHLLHYVPERRGSRLDIVEDRLPVRAAPLSLRGEFSSAEIVPSRESLGVHQEEGRTVVNLPDFDGAMVVLIKR